MGHRFEFILFQFLKTIVLLLPLKSAQRFGMVLGDIAYHLISGRRKIALENLRHAFPEKTESERVAIAKGSFRNYGIAFIELLWFPNMNQTNIRNVAKFPDLDTILNFERQGKGLIVLAAHFGSWELNAFATGCMLDKPLLLIVQTQSNKLVDAVINRHRCLMGNRFVPMGMAVREIIRTLENKGNIILAADQSAAKESVHIEFFGRKVATHEGPAVFALRTGAPIVMEFYIRLPDLTYRVEFVPLSLDNLPIGREEQVFELTRRHTELLERYVRQYPDHWLWMHRRWKHVEETTKDA